MCRPAENGAPKIGLDTCCVQYYISNPQVQPWADRLDPIFQAGLRGKADTAGACFGGREACAMKDRGKEKTRMKRSILDDAKAITAGARQRDYGHPRSCCADIAAMWTVLLRRKLGYSARITAEDVPLCMIAVKLVREANRHKRDNLTDIAGYARLLAVIWGDEPCCERPTHAQRGKERP